MPSMESFPTPTTSTIGARRKKITDGSKSVTCSVHQMLLSIMQCQLYNSCIAFITHIRTSQVDLGSSKYIHGADVHMREDVVLRRYQVPQERVLL